MGDELKIDFDCISDVLLKELGKEGLGMLRDLLVMLKEYISVMYDMLVVGAVNRNLEDLVMKVKIEPFLQMSKKVSNSLNNFSEFFNNEELVRCLGVSEVVDKLKRNLKIVVNTTDVFQEVVNRYNFMSVIEDYQKTLLDEGMKYLDLLIDKINYKLGGLGG